MEVDYLINGKNFKRYGVHVESSSGVIDALRLKPPVTQSWPDSHGAMIGVRRRLYEAREIVLQCFMVADSNDMLIKQFSAFIRNFSQRLMESNQDLQQLIIDVDHPTRPLVYMVHLQDSVIMQKKWRDGRQVGTFTLRMIEPEPVKIVYEKVVTETEGPGSDSTMNITFQSDKARYRYNVYWGTGQSQKDIFTEMGFAFVDFTFPKGRYYVVITGDVDDTQVSLTETENARLIWEIYH